MPGVGLPMTLQPVGRGVLHAHGLELKRLNGEAKRFVAQPVFGVIAGIGREAIDVTGGAVAVFLAVVPQLTEIGVEGTVLLEKYYDVIQSIDS